MKLVRARWPFVAEMRRGSGESFRSTWISLRLRQFLDERLRVSQIRGSQSLGKTTVNRCQQRPCFILLVLPLRWGACPNQHSHCASERGN
jgi:hypothetical protein